MCLGSLGEELWVSNIRAKLSPGLGWEMQIEGNRRQGLAEREKRKKICKYRSWKPGCKFHFRF